MKVYFHALWMCQSMFCAIPFPGNCWNEQARSKMLLFLPCIGLEIGAIWAGLGWLSRFWGLPPLAAALVLAAFPYLVTGFMHLDGFMDVTDAVRSWRSPERRREILKDSHVGSFSVIGAVLVILAQFALLASAPAEASLWALGLIPAASRCCSALAVTTLPPMTTSQYAGQRAPRWHIAVLSLLLLAVLAAGFLLGGRYGFAPVGCLVGYGLALRRGYRSLEGMNGDIAGYALTIGELCGVAVFALI